MKRTTLGFAVRLFSLLCLAAASHALAQAPTPVHYAGVLNDYTPADPTISGSPYEMHGQWSVDLDGEGNGDFYADMTMSDYATTNGLLDATKGGQNAHTHHIRLTKVAVTSNMTGCPSFSPPTTMGFQLNGTVSLITGNGGKAPFEPTTPPTSTLQVCITGGNTVPYANLTMVFGGPAKNHFGTQPIHGVVRTANANSTDSSVVILSPSAGSSVSGVVTVQGAISLNLDSAGSFLIVDGAAQNQHRVVSAPYVYSLDTRTLSNGPHTLQLWAHDTGNNTTLSSVVQINVAN